MSEELQRSSGGGISYADVVPDTAGSGLGLPGIVDGPNAGLKMPERVDFAIVDLADRTLRPRSVESTTASSWLSPALPGPGSPCTETADVADTRPEPASATTADETTHRGTPAVVPGEC